MIIYAIVEMDVIPVPFQVKQRSVRTERDGSSNIQRPSLYAETNEETNEGWIFTRHFQLTWCRLTG